MIWGNTSIPNRTLAGGGLNEYHRTGADRLRWRLSAGVRCRLMDQASGRNLLLMSQPIITCSPDILGGTPVFTGTRVPVQTLLDYLEGGETIDDFLEGFPTVKREQVIAFLEEAKARMVASAS